ncbi:MAG: GTP-binding protein [Promethearchaeota archaeon]|nr:MAG: GTP-binding protein [Candidatus Lokiarchaeota archaeon]
MSHHLDRLYKICIVGDGAVGKTTILHQYVDDKFVEDTKVTIGTNLFIKRITIPEINTRVTLQIWDLGGQERFFAVRPNFYAGAHGIIYTFDLTRFYSLINLKKWKDEIDRVVKPFASILIGNKMDLIDHDRNRPISKEEGHKAKEDLNACCYIETSAKENIGVDKAFLRIAQKILNSKY